MAKTKNIVKDLSLSEISGVTVPAQSHALTTIMKSAHIETITKYLSTEDGAKSFSQFLTEDSARRAKYEAREAVWPLINALNDSINSIVGDAEMDGETKHGRIRESVSQFLGAMQYPETDDSEEILEIFTDSEEDMSDVNKVADLEKQLADALSKLADAEIVAKLSDSERKHLASLDEAAAAKFKGASADERQASMKKAAEADEMFKSHTGVEIRKSDVGAGIYTILKAQDEQIAKANVELNKAREQTLTVELTKVAEDEYGKLPGDTVAKVAVLKAVNGFDEATKATLTQMLKAGNAALNGAFTEVGARGDKVEKAAELESLTKAYADTHKVHPAVAQIAVLNSRPDLYEG